MRAVCLIFYAVLRCSVPLNPLPIHCRQKTQPQTNQRATGASQHHRRRHLLGAATLRHQPGPLDGRRPEPACGATLGAVAEAVEAWFFSATLHFSRDDSGNITLNDGPFPFFSSVIGTLRCARGMAALHTIRDTAFAWKTGVRRVAFLTTGIPRGHVRGKLRQPALAAFLLVHIVLDGAAGTLWLVYSHSC